MIDDHAEPSLEYTHTRHGFLVECPSLPEDASDYERQEINNAWRHAMDLYAESVNRACISFTRVAKGVPETQVYANDVQKLAQAVAAQARLAALLDGVHHRLVLEEKLSDKLKLDSCGCL